jgi:5-formyltetrahydrofolate cyclo-ligase
MRFTKITPATPVESNANGIPEPLSFDFIDPKILDAIVVPMLVADKKGFRVGYGKGFYDAFLPNCRADCLRIGISYFPPIESISDVGNHDEALHLCISP